MPSLGYAYVALRYDVAQSLLYRDLLRVRLDDADASNRAKVVALRTARPFSSLLKIE